ncbi:DNA-directed RNA polymerase II subunit RPB1 [Purpureocillium lavendulum]|uniref:DNA-directed RNA polymerase II subunit RPB1 n=1 Tax=Purpureocillium lavendulum TaxID=1247861 RepID=A0AB34FWH0_9HYPO|nr:DNA-directed RNA polymerase II subunit RPB1 [Purpureocillium lavendulum]
MDAHALLTSQGWRGKGHSLHKTDDAIGLAKPLLLSRKDDTRGLGTKQHFTSDQWWMNAFDEQLKGLDTSKDGKVRQTVTTGKLNSIEKGSLGRWYLYASFVKGGFLEGTARADDDKDSSSSTDSDDATPPKTDALEPRKETKEERRARKEAKRKRKEERAKARAARRERRAAKASSRSASSSDADEEKRRRRAKKEEKRRKRKARESNPK